MFVLCVSFIQYKKGNKLFQIVDSKGNFLMKNYHSAVSSQPKYQPSFKFNIISLFFTSSSKFSFISIYIL